MPEQLTHNETMFKLIENMRVTIEHAQRTIRAHIEENSALDRFTDDYLTRVWNESITFSGEYSRLMTDEYRWARDDVAEDEELAEALANAPGPSNDRDVMELEPE